MGELNKELTVGTEKWYVLHVYSGFEKKVAASIMENATKRGLDKYIAEVMVPTQEVIEIKRGKRETNEQNVFPGYVLVKMAMQDDAWHLVKSTPKVTGFLGAGVRPTPITEREALRIARQVEEGAQAMSATIRYEVGETIKVIDGPFASFDGLVEEVDEAKQRLKVSVSIFGRATPVELDYTQVQKA